MILFVVLWLNSFPPVGGISQTYYRITIMKYFTIDYSKQCRVQFGTYAEKHEDVPPTNTMAESLQGEIYLLPTANFHRSCKLISLKTGQMITRKQLTQPPMTKSVIKQVEDMSIKEGHDEDPIFTDRNGSTLEVYNNDVNTHDITTGVDNNYNSNNTA